MSRLTDLWVPALRKVDDHCTAETYAQFYVFMVRNFDKYRLHI